MRFHISPHTGEPMLCRASRKCPFGDLEKDHFPDKETARIAYEDRMSHKTLTSYAPGQIRVEALPRGMKQSPNTVVIPKGVYIIGDPYYTAGSDQKAWRQWESEVARTPQDNAVGATYNGFPVVALKTPGDGYYYDSMGRGYNSRSGYIGLIPVSLGKNLGMDHMEMSDDGYLVNFNETTKVEWEKGTLYFGDRLFMRAEPDQEEDAELDFYDVDAEGGWQDTDETDDYPVDPLDDYPYRPEIPTTDPIDDYPYKDERYR